MTRELVCLHGINNTGRAFDGLDRALFPGWQIHTPDLPPLADVDLIADHLLALLPREFVLLGHSFGGYVALAILARAPQRVRGLVLINSSDGADSPAMAARRQELAARAEAGGYAELSAAATTITYCPDALERPELMEARARDLEAYGPVRYAAHQRACAKRPDRGTILAAHGGPVLVLAAREDRVISCTDQSAMATRVGAEFAVVEGAGHMLPVERADLVSRLVGLFLAERIAGQTIEP